MKSGTEKKPNPKSVSLSKFLHARSRHGQIIRADTLRRWQREGRAR